MLINRELAVRALEEGRPLKGIVNRCTGRTTAAVLAAIAESIRKPGEYITVRDESTPDLNFNLDWLKRHTEDTVNLLGLRAITVQLRSVPYHEQRGGRSVQIVSRFAEALA